MGSLFAAAGAAGSGAAAGTAATSAAAGSSLGATLGSAAAGTTAAQALGSGMSQGMSDVMSGAATSPIADISPAVNASNSSVAESATGSTTDKVSQYLDWAAKINEALKGPAQPMPTAPTRSLGNPSLMQNQTQNAPQAFPVSALSSIRR